MADVLTIETLHEIRNKVEAKGYDVVYKERIKRVKEDHVFDEDKSVKWNREKAKEHNENVKAIDDANRKASRDMENQFASDLTNVLKEEYSFTNEVAKKVFYKAWQDGHSSGYYSVVSEAEDIAEFVSEIMELNKK